jgi:hypothetical protein
VAHIFLIVPPVGMFGVFPLISVFEIGRYGLDVPLISNMKIHKYSDCTDTLSVKRIEKGRNITN